MTLKSPATMRTLLSAAACLLFLLPQASLAADDPWGELEQFQLATDDSLEKMRGKYFDVFFSINFTGRWGQTQTPSANLSYEVGLGSSMASSGQFSFTLLPGSGSTDQIPSSATLLPSVGDDSAVAQVDNGGAFDAVSSSASIGGGSGGLLSTGGATQITQVPGSNNFVYQGMNINLWMVNVQQTANAESIRSALSNMLKLQ